MVSLVGAAVATGLAAASTSDQFMVGASSIETSQSVPSATIVYTASPNADSQHTPYLTTITEKVEAGAQIVVTTFTVYPDKRDTSTTPTPTPYATTITDKIGAGAQTVVTTMTIYPTKRAEASTDTSYSLSCGGTDSTSWTLEYVCENNDQFVVPVNGDYCKSNCECLRDGTLWCPSPATGCTDDGEVTAYCGGDQDTNYLCKCSKGKDARNDPKGRDADSIHEPTPATPRKPHMVTQKTTCTTATLVPTTMTTITVI